MKRNVTIQNVNGLKLRLNLNTNLQYVLRDKCDIAMLVDTRLDKATMKTFKKAVVGYLTYAACNNSGLASRGVAILVKEELVFKAEKIFRDSTGNFIIMNSLLCGEETTIAAFYGPTSDYVRLYKKFFEKLNSVKKGQVLFAGDFNATLKQSKDTKNYTTQHKPKAREYIKQQMNQEGYSDVCRLFHSDGFLSWKKWNGDREARLDYFFADAQMADCIRNFEMVTRYSQDLTIQSCQLKLN